MNTEQLIKIGLSKELAEAVLRELDDAFVPKARFNEVNGQLKKVNAELNECKNLKQQYDTLKALYDECKNNLQSQIDKVKMEYAVNQALADAGAKNFKAVSALIQDFIENAEFKDGQVCGLKEELKRMASDPETAFLFNPPQRLAGFIPSEKMDYSSGYTYPSNLSEAIRLHLSGNF